jgi:hypothetical protein
MISSGEREALRLAVAPVALITVSSLSCLGPSMIDTGTLALSPEGHQHEQQPGRDGRGRHDLLRRPGLKNQEPLEGTRYCPVWAIFTLEICKIRQLEVVFTTFLNWLLKTLLKRICTDEGRKGV